MFTGFNIESGKHQNQKTMKRTIVLIAALLALMINNIEAQQYYCEASAGNLYSVNAKSGLSLRSAPSLISNKITAVPFGKEVTVCSEFQSESELIGGKEGKWVRAWYRGNEGYMFNAFLEAHDPITVNYPGHEGQGKYLGLYPEDGLYTVKAYQFDQDSMVSEDAFVEDPFCGIASPESPIFLFKGIESSASDQIVGQQFDSKFLFPGESVYFETDQAAYYIYAKGSIVSNDDENNPNPFSMIRNYQIRVRKVSDESTKDVVLYQMDIPSWYGHGYEGGVQVQWIGDLDGDGELDMLLTTSSESHCSEVIFMLSSKAERGHLMRQVSREMACCGC